jgi:cephalosporin-C deacetylase
MLQMPQHQEFDHPFSFDPSHGFDLESLLNVQAPDGEPSDFDVFWRQKYEEALSEPLCLERLQSPFQSENHHIEIVRYTIPRGIRTAAYLLLPKTKTPKKLVVKGHGYGGRDEPNLNIDRDTVSINPIAPGFHLSESTKLKFDNKSHLHVIHGIENPDSYIFNACTAAIWSSATILLDLFPSLANTLIYSGWSYGGGMGCLMLPWDHRFVAAELGHVSFCHHPMRLTTPCVGSGQAVTSLFTSKPHILETLRYFDGAYSSQRINIPTVFACATFDPAVPPPGQFCAYNVCQGPKRLSSFSAGHFHTDYSSYAAEEMKHLENLREFQLEH